MRNIEQKTIGKYLISRTSYEHLFEVWAIKILIIVKPLQMSVSPYPTKMLITQSTYKIFISGFVFVLLWAPQKSGYCF